MSEERTGPAGPAEDYWRGRVDGHLENLDRRLEALEIAAETRFEKNSVRLDHIHACLERRSKILYLFLGGLTLFYVLLQIAAPLFLRSMTKP